MKASEEKTVRNQEVYLKSLQGESHNNLAKEYNLSVARVSMIIARQRILLEPKIEVNISPGEKKEKVRREKIGGNE